MNRIVLHPGYHSASTLEAVKQAWDSDDLLVLCPPRVREYSFLGALPEGRIDLVGDWEQRPEIPARRTSGDFSVRPVLGVFTTGTSSGEPRLVLYSKRNIETSLRGIMSFFDESRVTSLFCYPQPSHTFGLLLGYVLSHLRGYRLWIAEGRYGSHFHERRVTIDDPGLITLGTPTHFHDLLSYVDKHRLDLAPTYSAIAGGAPVPVRLWRALLERLKIDAPSIGYGATEASPGITHLPPGREPARDGEIGFPIPGLDVQATEDGVRFRGASVALAVVEAGRARRLEEGFLRDALEAGADGSYVFKGRREAWLNRGGEKFSLEAIEAELSEKLQAPVLCAALDDERLGQELGVLVEKAAVSDERRAHLQAALWERFRCRFPGARWSTVAALPLDANAKLDRRAAAAFLSEFPAPVARFATQVPHRPPMVWVSEVRRADAESGECRLVWRSDGAYNGPRGIRRSSLIELMAQSYAFVRASQPDAPRAEKAYLAALSRIELKETPLADGEFLTIAVRVSRRLGPIAVVDATVRRASGEQVASGQLKLFAQ